MAEKNIIAEYAKYLQLMNLLSHTEQPLVEMKNDKSLMLSYKQFKAFFILKLVGKNTFMDSLVRTYQEKILTTL